MKTSIKLILLSLLLGVLQPVWAHRGDHGHSVNCAKGTSWFPSQRKCLTQKQWDDIKKAKTCPKGQSMNNGKCINSTCPQGLVWAPSLGQCMTQEDFNKLGN